MATPMDNSMVKSDHDKNDEFGQESGRVGRVEFHILGYFRRVSETIQEGFENDEHRDGFLQNVFNETEGQEVKLCQNQTISRILEELLPLGSSAQLLAFFKGLATDLETVMYDRFGAHVLQTTLMLSLDFLARAESPDAFDALILTLSESILGQVESVVVDTYASHVMGTLLQVLGGVQVADKVTRSKLSRDQQKRELVKETKVILQDIPTRHQEELMSYRGTLTKSKQIEEYVSSPTACSVLAVLILVLQEKDQEQCQKVCRKIAKKCGLLTGGPTESAPQLPEVVKNSVSSGLMETLVDAVGEDLFKELLESSFHGNLLTLAKTPVANFILQHLIARAAKLNQVDQIMSELSLGFRDILAVKHTGVLLHLAEACVLCPAHQEAFVRCLLESLDCFEPEERQLKSIIVVAALESHETIFATDEQEPPAEHLKIQLHGSLLLQNLLKFQNKRVVVNGFMALSGGELKVIACQPAGSHLLEEFMANERIKDKKKETLLNTVKEHLFTICSNKYGSRVIESTFKTSSIKIKTIIAEELSKRETQLHSDRFGTFVHRTCQLSQYKHRRHAWTSSVTKDEKKRKLFADVIGDKSENPTGSSVSGTNKKKKKHHKES